MRTMAEKGRIFRELHAKPGLIVLEVDCSAMHARDRGGERKS